MNVYTWNGTSYTKRPSDFGEDDNISFSLSRDGTFMAVGYPEKGAACVYVRTGPTYTRRVDCLSGSSDTRNYGWTVKLSDDGNVLAVIQPGRNLDYGRVLVYSWNGFNYVARGVNPLLVAYGLTISLSENGDVLALGAPDNSVSGAKSGTVYVYSWFNGTYTKRGPGINGTTTMETFGTSVSLSIDGNILAVGAPGKGGDKTGCVRVYSWDGNNYIPRTNDTLDGERPGDNYGHSVSLSSDGMILAVGAFGNDAGRVLMYKWNGTTYGQGGKIFGQVIDDHFGYSVSLSGDGKKLAVGAPYYDKPKNETSGEKESKSGNVRVFV